MKVKLNSTLAEKLVNKARQSKLKFKVSAIAFDHKGDILGTAKNGHRNEFPMGGKGRGAHAERVLIDRYGDLIHTILICRVGLRGDLLPIDPCDQCKETADKLGIKIISSKE